MPVSQLSDYWVFTAGERRHRSGSVPENEKMNASMFRCTACVYTQVYAIVMVCVAGHRCPSVSQVKGHTTAPNTQTATEV